MSKKFVDLQVNGYRGINFSSPDLTLKDIHNVSTLLAERGVAGYCPTIITSPMELYEHNLPLIAEAVKTGGKGAKVLGVHLEGPFINPEPGPRGIHQAKYVVSPSIEMYERFKKLSEGTQALITVAPDQPGVIELIRHITGGGDTVVSIGHHLASPEQIDAAVSAGARAATHVGNGLPSMLHRHQNPLWSIMADDRLYAFFIADGFHIPPALIQVLLKTKTTDKLILTSDLMHFGGLEPGDYRFGDMDISLEENGKLHHAENDQLAGAALPIDRCAKYLQSTLGFSPEDIHRISFENPLKLLKLL